MYYIQWDGIVLSLVLACSKWIMFFFSMSDCFSPSLLVAVKCNDDPAVVSVMASLGTGFDCASKVRRKGIVLYSAYTLS